MEYLSELLDGESNSCKAGGLSYPAFKQEKEHFSLKDLIPKIRIPFINHWEFENKTKLNKLSFKKFLSSL